MEAETKRLQRLAEEKKKQEAVAPEASTTTIESPGSQAIRDLLEQKQAEAAKVRELGMVEDELAKREVAEAAKKNKAIREAKEAEELAAKKVAEAEAELKRKAEEEEEANQRESLFQLRGGPGLAASVWGCFGSVWEGFGSLGRFWQALGKLLAPSE